MKGVTTVSFSPLVLYSDTEFYPCIYGGRDLALEGDRCRAIMSQRTAKARF